MKTLGADTIAMVVSKVLLSRSCLARNSAVASVNCCGLELDTNHVFGDLTQNWLAFQSSLNVEIDSVPDLSP